MTMKMKMCSLLLFLLSTLPANISHSSYYSDQNALLAFKNALSVDPWNSLDNWSPNHTTCNWTGVTCSSRRQRVVSLNLTSMGLVGPISPFLGNLSFLRLLSLSANSFQGQIPYQLGRLFRLRMLVLDANKLEGSIPSQLGLLPSLERLRLRTNQLTGSIPSSLGNLSSLTVLNLAENGLQGGIPVELGMLTQLYWLNLNTNKLTGPIPISLSNCSHLQILQLYRNNLSGKIPWEFGRLSKLQEVYLWGNQLSGEIPRSVGNWTQLQVIYSERNHLSGTVPVEFGNMQQLRRLILWDNLLVSGSTGLSILSVLTNCSNLEQLQLGLNYLTGILPNSIGRLPSALSLLALNSNKIGGHIPDEIGNLTNLATLTFEANNLYGTIPSALCQLPKMERLILEKNNLQGRIPQEIGQSKRLGMLALSENTLTGQIPDSLGNLPQLRELYLDHNQLSGEIPASLGRCKTLGLVDLAYNKLTGNIPPEVAGLPNLQFYFNVSNNLLQGSVLEMSKMVMVLVIDVSVNLFSGSIPSALESCTALENLNLSWNAFGGPIPASLANLQNLQSMDLSCNNLSGAIPVAFTEMQMLHHLNLSSNNLTGEVPNGGIFATLDSSAIMGNIGLCGTWINLPPCSHSKHKQLSTSKKVIVPAVIGIAIFILSFLLLVFSYRWRHANTLDLKVGPPRILYEELVDATGGFNDINLLGIGSFGSVYKGILKNGTNIAVKVLNLHDENARQSFSRECNTLKRVRHRNIIKIISVCSNLDFKGLVLPYMSNGSLEKWLYHCGGECQLNLSDRLKIAMEIAEGMAYLHHQCFVQVIHCDLKPSNVLLGDDMTTYIADFGIAKLLFGNSMDSLTSTNVIKGSTGYIAPEYGMGGNISTKGDVYSYGILLFELLTRRRPTDDMFIEGINIQKWVGMNFPNKIIEVVDNNLLRDASESEITIILSCLTQFMWLGLICTRELPQQRPDMTEVVERLDTIKSKFLCTPRAFQLPIDITPLVVEKKGKKSMIIGSQESWITSTSTSTS